MRAAGVATGRGSSVCGVPPLLPSDLLPCRSLPSFHRLQSIKVSLPCKSKKSQQQQRQWHSSATTATASLRVLLRPVPHILYPLTVFWQIVECCHRIGIGEREREREREISFKKTLNLIRKMESSFEAFANVCGQLRSRPLPPPQRARERERDQFQENPNPNQTDWKLFWILWLRETDRKLSLNPLQMVAVHDRMWRTCCGQLKSRPLPPEMLNPFFSHHPTTTAAAANLIKCLMWDQSGNGKRHM